SNAIFTVENMFVWNVLPPCIATIAAISLIGTVSLPMAGGLIVVAGGMVIAMFHLAAAGKPLHDDFADKAASVDGEMVDVINNLPLVRAFCGLSHEHDRFDATVDREITARGRSLRYLEKLRLTHAAVTVVLIVALLAWGIRLWQQGGATTGDVVLICTLGLSILNATRDLAVALVDVTACSADDRSDCDAAAASRAPRPPQGRAAGAGRRGDRLQQHLLPVSRWDESVRSFQPSPATRSAGRARGPVRRRKVVALRTAAALL